MHGQTAVINTQGLFNIHTAYYASPAPRGNHHSVNGSSGDNDVLCAQTLAFFLQRKFINVVLFEWPYAGRSQSFNHQRAAS